MPIDDKLKYESNQSLSDSLVDIGTTAAAAGAVAVALYRGGGVKQFNKLARKYAKAIRSSTREISSMSYYDINKRSLNDLANSTSEAFKNAPKAAEVKGRLSVNSPVAERIIQGYTLSRQNGSIGYGSKSLYHESVTKRAISDLRTELRNIKDVSEKEFDDAESLIRKHVANLNRDEFLDMVNKSKGSPYLGVEEIAYDAYQKGITSRTESAINKALENALGYANEYKAQKNIPDNTNAAKQLQELISGLNELEKANKSQMNKTVNTVLGDRGATIGDILDNPDKFEPKFIKFQAMTDSGSKSEMQSVISILKDINDGLSDADKARFRALTFDPYTRMDAEGNASHFNIFEDIKKNFMDFVSGTMPGKILKLDYLNNSSKRPVYNKFNPGDIVPAIAKMERDLGFGDPNSNAISREYAFVDDSLYRYDIKDGIGEYVDTGFRGSLLSSRGPESSMYKDMFGMNSERVLDNSTLSGRLGNFFEFGLSANEGITEKYGIQRDKFDLLNVLDKLRTGSYDGEDRYEVLSRVRDLVSELVKSTSLTESDIAAIAKASKNSQADVSKQIAGIFENTSLTDEEFLDQTIAIVKGITPETAKKDPARMNLNNARLLNIVESLFRNEKRASDTIDVINDMSGAYVSGERIRLSLPEILRREMSRTMLTENATVSLGSGKTSIDYQMMNDFVDSLDVTSEAKQRIKAFGYASLLEENTNFLFTHGGLNKLENATKEKADAELGNLVTTLNDAVMGDDITSTLRGVLNELDDSFILRSHKRDRRGDLHSQNIPNSFFLLSESEGPLNILSNTIKGIKEQSKEPIVNSFETLFKQVFAGRDSNPDMVGWNTFVPYFFLHRLGTDDMPSALQWSRQSTSSTFDLAKTIFLKRIVPVGVGYTSLEWADDTVGLITGTRASAGFINSYDYFELGLREFADATGIGSMIDNHMYVNPAAQYWGGRDGYRTADEEREWLANGYSEVRSGRYWAFGSINEFRGGSIQYYLPNMTRRLNSDYYNKSMYESYWQKWSHSLMPTPLMPFSPLVYMLDPYYLEEYHYDDRPYMSTGKMFQENTPWGLVLNPTIGELIKPVKKMHTEHVQDGQDIRAISREFHKKIRDLASEVEGNMFGGADHAYTMTIKNGEISPGEYVSYSSPELGVERYTVGEQRGILGNSTDPYEKTWDKNRRKMLYDASVLQDSGVRGAVNMLGFNNERIKALAYSQGNNYGGVLINDSLGAVRNNTRIDKILNDESMHDLINASQGFDLVSEGAGIMRLVGGIYGYGANRAFGFGENDGKIVPNAGDMTSTSRQFWDMALGGLGGGTAEIGRRFIPDFRRGIRHSPVLNTMPEWLGEKYRTGDPFSMIPDGEARLPGKGYEALNELHPDEFGKLIHAE